MGTYFPCGTKAYSISATICCRHSFIPLGFEFTVIIVLMECGISFLFRDKTVRRRIVTRLNPESPRLSLYNYSAVSRFFVRANSSAINFARFNAIRDGKAYGHIAATRALSGFAGVPMKLLLDKHDQTFSRKCTSEKREYSVKEYVHMLDFERKNGFQLRTIFNLLHAGFKIFSNYNILESRYILILDICKNISFDIIVIYIK